VPPDLPVEVNGVGILGAFVEKRKRFGAAPPGGTILQINGVAILGGVEIVVREPKGGVSGWHNVAALPAHGVADPPDEAEEGNPFRSRHLGWRRGRRR
jgi:hypothetical protein